METETHEPAGELDPGEVNRHVQRTVKPLLAQSVRMRRRVMGAAMLILGLTDTQRPLSRTLDSAEKPAEEPPAP